MYRGRISCLLNESWVIHSITHESCNTGIQCISITEVNGAWKASLKWGQSIYSPVAHNPPRMKDGVSLSLTDACLQDRCASCIAALSPLIPAVKWKARVLIPAHLELMALGWQEPGRWHSRSTTKMLFIRSCILSYPHAYPMPQSVFWGEHVPHVIPNYLPLSLAPFGFPWHNRTTGLFALTSSRTGSVNVSHPNLNFSKKSCKDLRSGNTMRDKNKINPQKSHCHKLPG